MKKSNKWDSNLHYKKKIVFLWCKVVTDGNSEEVQYMHWWQFVIKARRQGSWSLEKLYTGNGLWQFVTFFLLRTIFVCLFWMPLLKKKNTIIIICFFFYLKSRRLYCIPCLALQKKIRWLCWWFTFCFFLFFFRTPDWDIFIRNLQLLQHNISSLFDRETWELKDWQRSWKVIHSLWKKFDFKTQK